MDRTLLLDLIAVFAALALATMLGAALGAWPF
jgi:hypothetical protein